MKHTSMPNGLRLTVPDPAVHFMAIKEQVLIFRKIDQTLIFIAHDGPDE